MSNLPGQSLEPCDIAKKRAERYEAHGAGATVAGGLFAWKVLPYLAEQDPISVPYIVGAIMLSVTVCGAGLYLLGKARATTMEDLISRDDFRRASRAGSLDDLC